MSEVRAVVVCDQRWRLKPPPRSFVDFAAPNAGNMLGATHAGDIINVQSALTLISVDYSEIEWLSRFMVA